MTFHVNTRTTDSTDRSQVYTMIHQEDCWLVGRYAAPPKWQGPFGTYAEAEDLAESTEYPIRPCGRCKPNQWDRRPGPR